MDRGVTLYVIAGSHPCATVEAALRLKGVAYRTVELPHELHRLHQRSRFGRPTVPAREDSRLRLPPSLVRLFGPLVMRHAARHHGANEPSVRADLAALPAHLDRVDELIGDGVLGGERPNAADLQIGSSLKVLSDLEDVRPLLEGRPALALGERLFPNLRGRCPAGALPEARSRRGRV